MADFTDATCASIGHPPTFISADGNVDISGFSAAIVIPSSKSTIDAGVAAIPGTGRVVSAVVKPFENAGGLHASMKQVVFQVLSGEVDAGRADALTTNVSCILKTQAAGAQSKALGCAREAFFYSNFAPTLRKHGVAFPFVYYAFGDFNTGEKVLMLEDMRSTCVQSGNFFGPGSPLNWGKDLESLTTPPANYTSPVLPAGSPVSAEVIALLCAKDTATGEISGLSAMDAVVLDAFTQAAKLHAAYWMDVETLLSPSRFWLRGQQWQRGEGEESWTAAQNTAKSSWLKAKESILDNASTVKWDENLVACMDASIEKIDWTEYQKTSKTRQWTLAHGDFHPANMLWRWQSATSAAATSTTTADAVTSTVPVDWEVVGVGSGPQDVAQYLISHMEPTQRKQKEEAYLRAYFDALTAFRAANFEGKGVAYSWEQCRADYVSGGSERWIWLMAILTAMCPPPMVQYFQDQVAAFLSDHSLTPENIGMPRV